MKWKENLEKVQVVKYTKEQDEFNYVSHLFGVLVGVAICIAGIVLYLLKDLNILYLIGNLIFGVAAILLYFMSANYHHSSADDKHIRLKRVIDHCTIYVLIAGTYTPICLYIMQQNVIGLVLLIIQWVLALAGVLLNAYDFSKNWVKVISMFFYIALGWMILYSTAFTYLPTNSFVLLLIGGIAYTLGSVLYGIGHKKNQWFHCVFHIFVLIGTILQAIGVMFLLF